MEKKKLYRALQLLAAAFFLTLLVAPLAQADLITNISSPNSGLSAYTGPYATVDVSLNSAGTIATITFDSLTNNGYIYLMGSTAAADVNVNAKSFTVGTVTESNSISGFTPAFDNSSINSANGVDGFGSFNLQLTNVDGFKDSATSILFTITDTSGTWTSASDVLATNSNGAFAAIHAFACADPGCSTASANFTGYAANGGAISTTPEPTSMLLMGIGLFGLGWCVRRQRFFMEA